jgi:D-arginine dehydrogenase
VGLTPDVVVIGGGIAGVSLGYELAAHRRVMVVEAEARLGVHATGRSAAMYVPGHGTAPVRALIRASGPWFADLPVLLGGPRPLRPRPVLWAAIDEPGEFALRTDLAERAGEPDAPRELSVREALARCPLLRADRLRAAAITEKSGDIDVAAVHQAYLRGLRARGGTVLPATRVIGLAASGSGWRVSCAGGQVLHAAEVVDAAGAWVDAVATLAGVRPLGLRALRRTIVVARVPGDPPILPCVAGLPMVVEAAERCHIKPAGERLLLSPADETPQQPGEVRVDPRDISRALHRVAELTMLGVCPVQSSWAGLRSFVADRVPVVGSRPDHPTFHFFAGQGGSGIEAAPALAALGASVITGHPPPPGIPVDPAVLSPLRLDRTQRRRISGTSKPVSNGRECQGTGPEVARTRQHNRAGYPRLHPAD